jgi:hypothetical protein
MGKEISEQQEQKTPGYEDFNATYEKLEKLRNSKTLDSHLFIYYVTICARYIQSLDPYEYQMVINAMPAMEEKIDTVKVLYSKVQTAIFDKLNEIPQKKDSPKKLA